MEKALLDLVVVCKGSLWCLCVIFKTLSMEFYSKGETMPTVNYKYEKRKKELDKKKKKAEKERQKEIKKNSNKQPETPPPPPAAPEQ